MFIILIIIAGITGTLLGSYIAYRQEKKEAWLEVLKDPKLMFGGPEIIEQMTFIRWLKGRFGL